MNVTDLVNVNSTSAATPVGVAPTAAVPHYIGLQFGEDGVRQPPLSTAPNNMIIIVLGLSLLIVPIVGFLVCMIAKSRVLKNLRGMKFTSDSGDGSGLPYSQFDSEPDDFEQNGSISGKKGTSSRGKSGAADGKNKDVRVLINNDNTFMGTPTKTKKSGSNEDALLRRKSVSSGAGTSLSSGPRSRNAPLNDDYATLDVDATFIVPSPSVSVNQSSSVECDSTLPNYPYVAQSYT